MKRYRAAVLLIMAFAFLFFGMPAYAVDTTDTGTLGADQWAIESDGDIVPETDSSYDIGASGAEVDNIYTDNVTCTGNLTVTGALKPDIVAVSDAGSITVNASDSGQVHIVPDLTADATFTLPAVAANLSYTFIYKGTAADAQDWIFDTGSDTNFYLGGVVQHDPDDAGDDTVVYYPDGDSNSILNVFTPEAGTKITLYCDGTNWTINGTVISATDTGVSYADQS
jgi:hypothetical protein